jgi:hypothetical protein
MVWIQFNFACIPAEETYQIRHKLGQIHHTKKAAVVRGKSDHAGKHVYMLLLDSIGREILRISLRDDWNLSKLEEIEVENNSILP